MANLLDILIEEKYQVKQLEKTSDGLEVIGINPDKLVETVTYLKMNADTRFDVLFSMSGVDKEECLEVVYHLFSTVFNRHLILKARAGKSFPEFESLSGLYSAANWHEREVYDLFGIRFLNHPQLERLLLPNDWQGYPLRKNYVNNDKRLSWNER